ncbi:MAG: hypothetical protein WD423_11440 [Rhodothermales bacterium]
MKPGDTTIGIVAALAAVIFLAACSPTLSPLYRDYRVPASDSVEKPVSSVDAAPESPADSQPDSLAGSLPGSGSASTGDSTDDAGGGTETASARSASVRDRIVAALDDAGWDTVATDLPHAIETEERVLSNWGIYRVGASLQVTPLGRDHVRLYVHPYRKYFIGDKGKIMYLTGRIESRFIPELNEAFKKHGLELAGTPFERDGTELR